MFVLFGLYWKTLISLTFDSFDFGFYMTLPCLVRCISDCGSLAKFRHGGDFTGLHEMLGDASWKKHVMTTDGAKWPNVSGDHSKFFWKIQQFLVCSAFENVRNLNRLWVMWDSWLVIVLIGQPCHDLNFANTVTAICCSIVPVGQVQSGEQGMPDGWRGLKSVWKSWIKILHHGAFRTRYWYSYWRSFCFLGNPFSAGCKKHQVDGRVYQSGSLKRSIFLLTGCWCTWINSNSNSVVCRYCTPTVESHQQNPYLPEAGGPLGHGRQLPAGAAHAAATAMATLGEQGANWKVEFVGKPWRLAFCPRSRWCWALPGFPPFGSTPWLHLQLWWPVNVAILRNFPYFSFSLMNLKCRCRLPSLWEVWKYFRLKCCSAFPPLSLKLTKS